MDIKLMKYMHFVENLLCVHRNLTMSGKVTRLLMIIHCLCELTVISANFALHEIYHHYFEISTERLYFCSSTIYSFVQIIIAVFRSDDFESFNQYVNSNHKFCKQCPNYNRRMEKLRKTLISSTVLMAIMQILIFAYTRFAHHFDIPDASPFVIFMMHLNLILCDYRYSFEILVLYSYLNIISEQLLYISQSIDEFKMTEQEAVDPMQMNKFDEWCTLYTNIRKSSNLFNTTFGSQMTMMLATMVFFYIIFLYTMASLSVTGKVTLVGLGLYIATTAFMTVVLAMLSREAQRAQNAADVLKRRLGKLLLHSLENEVYYRPAKDLLRLVSTRPIRTQAFGSIPVGMSLLPTCIVFFTNYTVIALQFNNIV